MRHVLLTAAALTIASAALANDSTAEIAAGGLVLRQTRDIDMVSEDLFVSVERVRVRYVFRNRSAKPVRTIVAFPIADRDLADEYEMDVASVGQFRTLVDGRPVQMQVERKAFARGIDQTALLRRLGIPIDNSGAAGEKLAKLSRADQDHLARLGLIAARTSFENASTVSCW